MQYHSYHEIFHQGESLHRTLSYMQERHEQLEDFFKRESFDEIIFVGCGSSYWLSLSAAETFTSLSGKRCSAVPAGEIMMHPENYSRRFRSPLIIAPSRSGNTSETIAAIDMLKRAYDCKVIGIAEYEQSKMEQLADLFLHLPWANETSVCQTRSFNNLYLACILVAGIVYDDDTLIAGIRKYVSDFSRYSKRVEHDVRRLLRDGVRQIVTLGHGAMYGVACEGAYINVEMAQMPAFAFYLLELRHGPIVLLNEQYRVICFSDGRHERYEADLLDEVRNKGAEVIRIGPGMANEDFGYTFTLDDEASPELIALFGSFVLQAFAYYHAIALQVDPDKPKDLVPWIAI